MPVMLLMCAVLSALSLLWHYVVSTMINICGQPGVSNVAAVVCGVAAVGLVHEARPPPDFAFRNSKDDGSTAARSHTLRHRCLDDLLRNSFTCASVSGGLFGSSPAFTNAALRGSDLSSTALRKSTLSNEKYAVARWEELCERVVIVPKPRGVLAPPLHRRVRFEQVGEVVGRGLRRNRYLLGIVVNCTRVTLTSCCEAGRTPPYRFPAELALGGATCSARTYSVCRLRERAQAAVGSGAMCAVSSPWSSRFRRSRTRGAS